MNLPIEDAQAGTSSRITLTVRERAVVGLMVKGFTDASIAQHLDLSRRTICYTVSGLLTRLGVVNRFQLAWVLGRLAVHVRPPAQTIDTYHDARRAANPTAATRDDRR